MRMNCACKAMSYTVLGDLHAAQCSYMSRNCDSASGVGALILCKESHESHRTNDVACLQRRQQVRRISDVRRCGRGRTGRAGRLIRRLCRRRRFWHRLEQLWRWRIQQRRLVLWRRLRRRLRYQHANPSEQAGRQHCRLQQQQWSQQCRCRQQFCFRPSVWKQYKDWQLGTSVSPALACASQLASLACRCIKVQNAV